ncbi:MAG: hypothetical protein PHU61_02660 [Candidatus Absconditabacteria bacterium]|nr:hypothetical protein [Candidatus Absconditabacteria bacterium]MDD3868127.1 hypothetical protein [Candidatus Absconditabacteria bacterium]MDD4714513.1 hypothetical protein [Candidatus Absconditabacteria bacterium]
MKKSLLVLSVLGLGVFTLAGCGNNVDVESEVNTGDLEIVEEVVTGDVIDESLVDETINEVEELLENAEEIVSGSVEEVEEVVSDFVTEVEGTENLPVEESTDVVVE